MNKRKIKSSVYKAFLGILVVIMIASVVPFVAFAAGGDGEGESSNCTHVCGVDACGYVEGEECTFPSTHKHETGCGYVDGEDSTCTVFAAHKDHDDACGYDEEDENLTCSTLDSHEHKTGCGFSGEEGSSCAAIDEHEHDDDCGYVNAVACDHECGEACDVEDTTTEGDGKEGTPPQSPNGNTRGAGDTYRIMGRVFIDKDMDGEYTEGEGLAGYTVVGAILKDDPENPGRKIPFGKDDTFDKSATTDADGIFSFEGLLETDEMDIYFKNPSEYYEVIVYEGKKAGDNINIVTVGPRVEDGHGIQSYPASSSTEPSFTMTTGGLTP